MPQPVWRKWNRECGIDPESDRMTDSGVIKILAISGSLRRSSSNTELLKATALLAPAGVQVEIEPSLNELPHFNPDLEGQEPQTVMQFRDRLRTADAVIISSPEYAHGVPGALKNALDWIVGSGELSGKPVAVLNVSPASTHAWNALMEIVRTMDARLVEEACVRIPLPTNRMTAEEILASPTLRPFLAGAVSALALAARSDQDGSR